MSQFFLIQPNWGALYSEIWAPLERSTSAPRDMFIELLRYASSELGVEVSVEAFSDSKLAKEEFKKLPTPPDEKTCIAILEGFHTVLSEFDTDIAKKYYLKLKDFVETRNLRYVLTPDCKIQLSLTGLLVSHYSTLRKSASQNNTRLQCLNELEINIGRIQDDEIEKNCIRVASNLLEEVVVDKTTNGETTLGRAIDGCQVLFPHQALIESLKKFCKFFNDYPNLRHPGSQAQKIRELKKDDAIISIWFAVMFASYLAENDACRLILSGDV